MQHMEYLSNACSSCTWSFGRLLLPKIHLCYTNNIPGFGITICATWALSFVSTCWRTHLEVRYHSAGPWSLRIWTNYETNHVVIDNHSKLEHRPPNMIKNKNTSQLEAIWKTSTKSVNIDKRLRIHQMKLCTNVKIRQLIFSSTNNNSNTAAVLVPAQPAVKKTINNLISRFPSNVEFLCSFFPLCSFHISFIFRLHWIDVQKAQRPASWCCLRFFHEAIVLEQCASATVAFDGSSSQLHHMLQSHPEQPLHWQCFPFCKKSMNICVSIDCLQSLHLSFHNGSCDLLYIVLILHIQLCLFSLGCHAPS